MYLNEIKIFLITVPVLLILTHVVVQFVLVYFGNYIFNDQFHHKKNDHGSDVLVNTKYGKIKGRTLYTLYKQLPYYSFRGIPYAQAPILDLRFKVHNLTYYKKQRRTKVAGGGREGFPF